MNSRGSDLRTAIEVQLAIAKSLGKDPNTLFITKQDWDDVVSITMVATEEDSQHKATYKGMDVFFIQEGLPQVGLR